MELTPKTEYALLALMALIDGSAQGKAMKVNQITAQHGAIPERYLEQILLVLRRGGIIKSIRGARGGYLLAREPQSISLLEVVSLLNGSQNAPGETTSVSPEQSAIHQVWEQIHQTTRTTLDQTTLQDLWDRSDRHRSSSPMYYI
ncbi:MAG: Rrf2 family transcriptional regulator [Alkalinema sp. RU_4_3]|nr:Rrf2 family transcriptional regulator [Alkalinema sp. RU_4_3]